MAVFVTDFPPSVRFCGSLFCRSLLPCFCALSTFDPVCPLVWRCNVNEGEREMDLAGWSGAWWRLGGCVGESVFNWKPCSIMQRKEFKHWGLSHRFAISCFSWWKAGMNSSPHECMHTPLHFHSALNRISHVNDYYFPWYCLRLDQHRGNLYSQCFWQMCCNLAYDNTDPADENWQTFTDSLAGMFCSILCRWMAIHRTCGLRVCLTSFTHTLTDWNAPSRQTMFTTVFCA